MKKYIIRYNVKNPETKKIVRFLFCAKAKSQNKALKYLLNYIKNNGFVYFDHTELKSKKYYPVPVIETIEVKKAYKYDIPLYNLYCP